MANVPSKFKLLESAQFSALVGKIGRTQAALTADIQTAAINAVAHSILHGNVMPAFQLYGAMGKSLRKDSLVAWLEKYGYLAWSKMDKKFLFDKRDYKFDDNYAEVLAGDPWNTAIRQPEPVSKFDIDAMFDKFMANARGIVKKAEGNPAVKVTNVELLNYLASASGQYFDAKVAAEAKRAPAKAKVTKKEKSNTQAKEAIAQAQAEQRSAEFNANIVAPTLVQQVA